MHFLEFCIYEVIFNNSTGIALKPVDNLLIVCYYDIVMSEYINKIPAEVALEADNLSKETGIPFRDCLEVLYTAYLDSANKRINDHIESVVASY